MPHAVTVDDPATRRLGDGDHAAIHMRRHTANHVLRRLAQSFHGPVAPHQLLITADAAGTDNDRSSGKTEFALLFPAALLSALHGIARKNRAGNAGHPAIGDIQPINPVAEAEG